MKCKDCQFENPEGIEFCINCGNVLVPPKQEAKEPEEPIQEPTDKSQIQEPTDSALQSQQSQAQEAAPTAPKIKKPKNKAKIAVIALALVILLGGGSGFMYIQSQNKIAKLYEKGNYSEIVKIYQKKGEVPEKDSLMVANALFEEKEPQDALEIYKNFYRLKDTVATIDNKDQLKGLENYIKIIRDDENLPLLEEFYNMKVETGKYVKDVKKQQQFIKEDIDNIKHKMEAGRIQKEIDGLKYKLTDGKHEEDKTGGYFIQNDKLYGDPAKMQQDFIYTIDQGPEMVTVTNSFKRKAQFKLKSGAVEVLMLGGKAYYNVDDLLKLMHADYSITIADNTPTIRYVEEKLRIIISGDEEIGITEPVIKDGLYLFPVFKIMSKLDGDKSGFEPVFSRNTPGSPCDAWSYHNTKTHENMFIYFLTPDKAVDALTATDKDLKALTMDVDTPVRPITQGEEIYFTEDLLRYFFSDFCTFEFDKDKLVLNCSYTSGPRARSTMSKQLTMAEFVRNCKRLYAASVEEIIQSVDAFYPDCTKTEVIYEISKYYSGDIEKQYDDFMFKQSSSFSFSDIFR